MHEEETRLTNQDISMNKEVALPPFVEVKLAGTEPAWCVDGRPDNTFDKGPQMLGGSLHPILLSAIDQSQVFNEEWVSQQLAALKDAGFTTGVHRGAHKHAEAGVCDCGFADKMKIVVETALKHNSEISERLMAVYEANKEAIGGLPLPFDVLVSRAYDKLSEYSLDNIALTGEALIAASEANGSVVEDVQGDHAEAAAFVNLVKDTTLNTVELNKRGQQAFNLDLWAAVDQSMSLGTDKKFAMAASLILYIATEMVLVEAKGKPALPVVIH